MLKSDDLSALLPGHTHQLTFKEAAGGPMTDVSPKQMGRLYIITKVHSSIKCQISIYALRPLFWCRYQMKHRVLGLVLVCDFPSQGRENMHHAQISALHHLETRTPGVHGLRFCHPPVSFSRNKRRICASTNCSIVFFFFFLLLLAKLM